MELNLEVVSFVCLSFYYGKI